MLYIGIDPGAVHSAWAVLDTGGHCLEAHPLRENGMDAEALGKRLLQFIIVNKAEIACLTVEWPVPYGGARASSVMYAATLRHAEGCERLAKHYELRVVKSSDDRIRSRVCGYSARRDGHADPFVREWLHQKGYRVGRGYLNSEQKRDAVMAALFGRLSVSSCQLPADQNQEVKHG